MNCWENEDKGLKSIANFDKSGPIIIHWIYFIKSTVIG